MNTVQCESFYKDLIIDDLIKNNYYTSASSLVKSLLVDCDNARVLYERITTEVEMMLQHTFINPHQEYAAKPYYTKLLTSPEYLMEVLKDIKYASSDINEKVKIDKIISEIKTMVLIKQLKVGIAFVFAMSIFYILCRMSETPAFRELYDF